MCGILIIVAILLASPLQVRAPATEALDSSEDSSEEEIRKAPVSDDSSSWTFASLTNFISKTSDSVNANIAALTKSAKNVGNLGDQLASKASSVTQSSKNFVNNRMLVGRIYSALREIQPRWRTPKLMVDAFATAITAELHEWMPTQVDLPSLEMKVKLKYLCGARGHISNLKTMKFLRSNYNEDLHPEDKAIDVILTFSFQYLHVSYGHFGESTFLTAPIKGTLDLEFSDNEVSFGMDIPNVSMFESAELTPECLISVKNFTVNKLALPDALIEPASAFRTFAEKVVVQFAKKHEAEFRNLFRLGVVKALHQLLQAESKWICKTKELEELAKIDEKNVMKPIDTKKFEKYCGAVTAKNDKNTDEVGNKLGQNKQKTMKGTTAKVSGDDEFEISGSGEP